MEWFYEQGFICGNSQYSVYSRETKLCIVKYQEEDEWARQNMVQGEGRQRYFGYGTNTYQLLAIVLMAHKQKAC